MHRIIPTPKADKNNNNLDNQVLKELARIRDYQKSIAARQDYICERLAWLEMDNELTWQLQDRHT